MTVPHTLNLYAAYAENFPSDERLLLVTDSGDTYSYGDAVRYSGQVANFLVAAGLQPGDRVTVQVEKSPENLWLFLGVIRAGLIYHPLNSAYTRDELRYFLGDAAPAMVVCDSADAAQMQALCTEVGVPALETLDVTGSGSLMDKVVACAPDCATANTFGTDIAALVYSSGTTGQPKGIMLTHANLVSNASTLADLWGFTPDDRLLHMLPIFHVHGLFVAIGCVLMSGASMHWCAGFNVQTAIERLPDSTVMMGVPTYYTRLLASTDFSAAVCTGMRLFVSGSAPLLPETFAQFTERTGHTILERYGMTETGMNTSNPLNGERKAGTVGLPLPGVDVRICGSDQQILAAGEIGDIQVRGPNVFAGYWNKPEKTREDFTEDGFLRTGDKGVMGEDGYLSIVGRSKDMVITGGLNVYPRELELLIDNLGGVLESAVIGLPDADFGEKVVAVVVCREGVSLEGEAVRDALKTQVAGFKVPKKVVFVEELPRNTMGKVRKDMLRASLDNV